MLKKNLLSLHFYLLNTVSRDPRLVTGLALLMVLNTFLLKEKKEEIVSEMNNGLGAKRAD